MLYYSNIKSLENHENKLFRVEFLTNNDGSQTTEIKLAYKNPVVITTDSDGIFSPIKSTGCTITLVTDEIISDLYSPENQGVQVTIKNLTDNEIIWEGFNSPCSYSQPYAKTQDTLEIECIDGLSTLENIKYSSISNTKTIFTVQEIVYNIFQAAGYTGNLYVPYDSFENPDMSLLKISETNFYDDDGEAWTCYEVLEQICLFFGWTATRYKNNLLLVDYETLQKSLDFQDWRKITNPFSSQVEILNNVQKTITQYDYAGTDSNLSMDETYNKISATCSIYELDEITTDIFDSDSSTLINNAANIQGSNHFIHTTKGTEDKAWTIYYTTYKFNTDSNWKQHYYDVDTFQEVEHYRNGSFNTDYGPTDGPNGFGNTVFAMPERYWILDDYATMTSSIDKKEVIAFNLMTYPKRASLQTLNNANSYFNTISALPVLEYEFPDEIQWKAIDGYSFICFKGDLWWGSDYAQTEVWQESAQFYSVFPYDGIETIAGEYNRIKRSRSAQDYNTGWPVMRAKLQIGNKYWNGSTWTTTVSDFWIYYHKEMMPLNGSDDEELNYGAWMHPVFNTVVNSNTIYFSEFDKAKLIGEDCLAIPINQNLTGKLKFSLYPPKQFPEVHPFQDNTVVLGSLCPVVYMKDFKLSYKFVPANYDTFNIDDYKSDSDIIYTNIINENYVTDFDELELKINTAAENKPISKSYIMDSSNSFIVNLTKNGVTKRQEHNLINMYYDHYSSPKKIYECTIHDYLHPASPVQITATSGNFVIDTQSYDVKSNHNTVKLIEY